MCVCRGCSSVLLFIYFIIIAFLYVVECGYMHGMAVYDEHAGPKAINSTIYGLLFPKSSNWRRFFRHILYGQESVLLSSDHVMGW